MIETDDRDVLLNRLADEFALRQRAGERPRVQEYCDRHPSLAEDIRSLFPAMVELERAKADAGTELLSATLPVTQMGDFRLIREVGRGGMGVVYEAEQISLDRKVALKLLPASVFLNPTKRRRFEREARAAAKLHHTNIVPVFGFGECAGVPYYVMQFIPGLGLDSVIHELSQSQPGARSDDLPPDRALSAALARSLTGEGTARWHAEADGAATLTAVEHPPPFDPRSDSSSVSMSGSGVHLPGQPVPGSPASSKATTYWESVARVGLQVAGALAYAHKLGVLHRDIKPANLLLDLDGIVWVTDFGLAKADDSDNLTHTGDVLGTFRYMPPEAFEGKSDSRSDIYALGLTLFELVALRPAYPERDRNKLVKQVTGGEVPSLRKLRPDAPRDLVTIVEKAIDRDPFRRYQTADALGEDLQRFLSDEPIRARRQSVPETVWRWARQHRSVSALLAVVALLLIAITIGSLGAAAYFRDLEKDQRALVQTKAALVERTQRLAEENDAAKTKAQDAQTRAEITLVDMQTARGLEAAERDDPARALLWFATAAEQSADPVRQSHNRLRTRNQARTLTVPLLAFRLGKIEHMDFQPGGSLLLLVTQEGSFVRDLKSDEFLPWCRAGIADASAACWSPDGASLAVGQRDGVVQIRGLPDGRVLQEVKHSGRVTSLAFSVDGRRLAIGGASARILDVANRKLLPHEWKHVDPIHSMVFNKAADRLVTAAHDRKVRVFDLDKPESLFAPLPHFPWTASPPVFVDDDRRLITVSQDGNGARPTELTAWDAETGMAAWPVIKARPSHPCGIETGPNGEWFAVAGIHGPEIWKSSEAGRNSLSASGHTGQVLQMAASPDGKVILTASWDQTARLWSVADGKPIGSPLPHMAIVSRCAFSGDGLHLATVADGLVRIWKRPNDPPADTRNTNWQGTARPSFDGRLVAPGVWREMPYGLSPLSGNELIVTRTVDGASAGPPIRLNAALVESVVCWDDSTVAAVSEAKGTGWFSLHDVATGRAVMEPVKLPKPGHAIAARPGHPHVAVMCEDGVVLIFDARTGEQLKNLPHGGEAYRLARLAYTPDGRTLVVHTEGKRNLLHVHDADTGELRFHPPIDPVISGGPLRSWAISPDSTLVATAVNGKNSAQVWDLANGKPMSEPLPHPGDLYGLFCICFTPDGRHLFTGCKDGQARLWDWKTGTTAGAPLKHDNEVLAAAITPDGRFAITSGRGTASFLHVWELKTGRLVAPKIPLPLHATAALAISPDGLYAVAASSFAKSLARVNLGKLLGSPEQSVERDRLLGELASGQRITHGDESGLTQDEWLERLERYLGRKN